MTDEQLRPAAGWATPADLLRAIGESTASLLRAYLGSGLLVRSLPAFALGGALAYWQSRRTREPPRVARLFIHPVKGAHPLEVPSVRMDELGFANDRRWAVADMKKEPLTRITHLQIDPRMALIRPTLDDHLGACARLTLKAAGMPDLPVPAPGPDAERIEVALWSVPGVALDCGAGAAEWLERLFGDRELRLIYLSPGVGVGCAGTKTREVCKEPHWSDGVEANSVYYPGTRVAFADSSMGTIMSATSLDDLNRRVPRGAKQVTLQQLRMNVILSGTKAYEEESWKSFCIAGADFVSSRLCNRCSAPNVDPSTGEKLPSVSQPLRLLQRYRSTEHVWRMDPRHKGPALGMKFCWPLPTSGTIHVGDPVTGIVPRGRGDRMY